MIVQTIPVSLHISFIFYYLYFFNLIEIESFRNVKHERRFEEKKQKQIPTFPWNSIWDAHAQKWMKPKFPRESLYRMMSRSTGKEISHLYHQSSALNGGFAPSFAWLILAARAVSRYSVYCSDWSVVSYWTILSLGACYDTLNTSTEWNMHNNHQII